MPKTKGTERRTPSKLLQLRLCLAFHTGVKHNLNSTFWRISSPQALFLLHNVIHFSTSAERPPDAQYHQLCISFPGGTPHWEQKAQTIDKQRKQARNEQLITLTQIQDHRTLPRVEMELVLTGKKIEFSPSCAEVFFIFFSCAEVFFIFFPVQRFLFIFIFFFAEVFYFYFFPVQRFF